MKTTRYKKHARHREHTDCGGATRMAAVLAVAASVMLAVCFLPSPKAYAAEITASGTDWTLDADGLLTIESDAGMTNWDIRGRSTNKENVKQAVINDGVTSIVSTAFSGCSSLTDITIPASVTGIETRAFDGCSSLVSITIPASVTSIGSSAFRDCSSLTEITIPDSVTSIGGSAFSYCSNLTNITIPDGVTTIEENAFKGCSSLTDITVPDGVKSIGTGAFWDCSSLTDITVPASVTSIGGSAFHSCSSLTDITIPAGVRSIGDYVFMDCSSLTEITIPDSVTSIGAAAFRGCTGLTEITIPASVTTIGASAFWKCTGLTKVTMLRVIPPTLGTGVFSDCAFFNNSIKGIYVPEGTVQSYKNKWSTIGGFIFDYTYLVTYNKAGGTITNEDSYKSYTEGKGLTLPTPTKAGRTFGGWYENKDYSGSEVTRISTADYGDKTYYAKWIFTVTYNKDGGTIADEDSYKSYIEGKGLTLPTPTKAGYAFGGWYEDSSFTGRKVSTILVNDMENKTYYAKWIEIMSGGSVTGFDPTADDYADTAINVRGFTKGATVYSVDVEWGAMTFQYENTTWDATEHKTVAGAGWKVYDSTKDKALDATEDAINEVKVTNHSNAAVWATLSYANEADYDPDTTGEFSFTKGTEDGDENVLTAATADAPAYLSLDTADNNEGEAEGQGKETVGKAYFMPSGIKEEYKTADGITKWTQIGTITVGILTEEP